MTDALETVQARINYEFKDISLLVAALTHSSYVNEHCAVGNERIEFLGDCVLNFLVGEDLYMRDPTASEGALSARRAATVSRTPLARIVDELGLLEYLRVGSGVNKAAFSDKARSDIYEALVGAAYLDGGMDACRKMLAATFFGKVTAARDFKSELQEYSVARKISLEYSDAVERDGLFEASVAVDGRAFLGTGRTKHAAQIAAARAALAELMHE